MHAGSPSREELITVAMLDVENAQELAEQAGKKLAATTQEVVAEGRKRVGREAKKRARKLERKLEHRVTQAAKRAGRHAGGPQAPPPDGGPGRADCARGAGRRGHRRRLRGVAGAQPARRHGRAAPRPTRSVPRSRLRRRRTRVGDVTSRKAGRASPKRAFLTVTIAACAVESSRRQQLSSSSCWRACNPPAPRTAETSRTAASA